MSQNGRHYNRDELDQVLARMEETDEIKEKQKQSKEVSAELEKSLEFAHESIRILIVQVDAQAKTISELEKGVNKLTKSASFEKARAIKLESHSGRNNLIFFGILEEVNETILFIAISSLYVRGLGNNEKRREMFQWLRKKKFSIYMLHEVHCTERSFETWAAEWGYKAFFSQMIMFRCEEIILGGDFNLIMDVRKDTIGVKLTTLRNSVKVIQNIRDNLDLTVIWRELNPEGRHMKIKQT